MANIAERNCSSFEKRRRERENDFSVPNGSCFEVNTFFNKKKDIQ